MIKGADLMKLYLSILFAALLGSLVIFGPIGWYLLGSIVIGVIFRSYLLLIDIHKRISTITRKPDKAREAYERYLNERERE